MENRLKQVHNEIRFLMEILDEQIQNSLEGRQPLPLIEKDLIKETLRKLYIQVDRLSEFPANNTDSNFNRELIADNASVPASLENKGTITEDVVATLFGKVTVPANIARTETIPAETNRPEPVRSPEDRQPSRQNEITPPAEVVASHPEMNVTPAIEPKPVTEPEAKAEVPTPSPAPAREEIKTTANPGPSRKPAPATASLFDEQPTVAQTYKAHETVVEKIAKTSGNRSLADTLQSKPLADLKSSIGINERFAFINELFAGDQQLYHDSIDTINRMQVYEEARRLIFEELSAKLEWDDKTSRLKQFDELVRRRFNA